MVQKFNNLGLALCVVSRFYTSVAKWLKLKVRNFRGLVPRFVEVTGEKLIGAGGASLAPCPSWIRSTKCANFLSNLEDDVRSQISDHGFVELYGEVLNKSKGPRHMKSERSQKELEFWKGKNNFFTNRS